MGSLLAVFGLLGVGFALGYKLGYEHVMQDVERIIRKATRR